MPTFKLVSFNAHGGLHPRRNGVCAPYDLETVLRGFDADVIVVQESWWPDDGPAAVDVVAADLGAEVFALEFGRGTLHPWPHVPRDGSGQGRVGLAVISKVPARVVAPMPLGHVFADQTPDRAGLHLELDVAGQPVDLIGVHLSSRLPYGPTDPAATPRGTSPEAGTTGRRRGRLQLLGPGGSHVLTRLAPRGPRTDLAGDHAPQPDRPHPRAARDRRRERRSPRRRRLRPPPRASDVEHRLEASVRAAGT